MSSRKRFVVEAEWSGYTSAQQRIVHRTVETLFRVGYENIGHYFFGDNTSLSVNVRDAKPRERVQKINGYGTLLRDLAMKKWSEIRSQSSGETK
jgi:hypothetical protein